MDCEHIFRNFRVGFFGGGGGDGGQFKAVLLSGPPGIGKTTTAILACKKLGFSYIHMNASDSRSKRILEEQFMGGVTNHLLDEWYPSANKSSGPSSSTGQAPERSVLVMDEVDGMAGNEDRGGIQVES